jgi:hypothetical protein
MVKRNIYSQVQCFHSNQEIEINPVSINGWDNKESVIHTMGFSSSIRRTKSCHFNSMNGTGDCFVKWNKPATERPRPHGLTHVWDLKLISCKLREEWRFAEVGERRERLINDC